MAIRTLPDVEALVGTYLRAHPDVAAIADDRIGTKDPPETADPWVKITHILGEPNTGTEEVHFGSTHLQLDCYGSDEQADSQEEANDLMRTVQAALQWMPRSSHSGAVVTRVATLAGPRLRDSDFAPPRDRYVLDCWVYAHAI